MFCPDCNKETLPDRVFCNWCESFIPRPDAGKKAGVFRRWMATWVIDWLVPYSFVFLFFSLITNQDQAGVALGLLFVLLVWAVAYLAMLGRGLTPGKLVMRERVILRSTGQPPGFLKMLLRELFGRFVSGLFLGLGYFWAIWDKDGQTWHDKIAGTVVVRRAKR